MRTLTIFLPQLPGATLSVNNTQAALGKSSNLPLSQNLPPRLDQARREWAAVRPGRYGMSNVDARSLNALSWGCQGMGRVLGILLSSQVPAVALASYGYCILV